MFTASCAPAGELHAGKSRVAINACYQQNKNRVEPFQPHSFDQIQRKGAVFSDCNSIKKRKKKRINTTTPKQEVKEAKRKCNVFSG